MKVKTYFYKNIYTFKIHNDDGVWLRLNAESASKWCPHATISTGGGVVLEAWALQYNQHQGKLLLAPLDEPKSILGEFFKDTIHKRRVDIPAERRRKGNKWEIKHEDSSSYDYYGKL